LLGGRAKKNLRRGRGEDLSGTLLVTWAPHGRFTDPRRRQAGGMGFAVKARRPRMGYRFKIISLPCTNPAEASCIIERPGALRNPSLCFVEEANKLFNAEGAEESMGAWGHLVLVLVLVLVLEKNYFF
jgi:hypothetical protein